MTLPAYIAERFWSKVIKGDITECWLWMDALTKNGYGRLFIHKGKTQRAHRIAWILTNGNIPPGLVVRHSCDNRKCVNPNHLSLGTIKDNNDDKIKRKRHKSFRTHYCPKGHPYSGDNLKINTAPSGLVSRHCRECERVRSLAHYHKNKEQRK